VESAHMEYTPKSVVRRGLPEVEGKSMDSLSGPVLVRRLRLAGFGLDKGTLLLDVGIAMGSLAIQAGREFVFGGEGISAINYLRRVLERGDLIDAVVNPVANGLFSTDLFWIHIVYSGKETDAGEFSRKEDGLFAMRAKAGEKAERVVARILRDDCGHAFPAGMCDSPGYFEIRYDKTKKVRRPDRRCLACGLEFEVKKRNRDEHFRVSHSEGRSFGDENRADGWHAFVFPDMKPRFVANVQIAKAILRGEFEPGSDRYDAWADIWPSSVTVALPPRCPAAQSA
jgi:hypothetical protein